MLTFPTVESGPTFPAQAVPDATDMAALGGLAQDIGVLSGCAVTPHSSGVDLHVAVALGAVVIAGASVAVAAVADLAVTAASASDRRDIVVVNAAGVVSVVAGAACGTAGWTAAVAGLPPVKPAIPASSVLLAEIYVPGAATSITAANLIDKSPVVPVSRASRAAAFALIFGG